MLVDGTPSMDFGTAEMEKRELAVAAVAAVGFLTDGAGNRLGAHVLGPDGVRRLPARTGRTHLLGMLRTLLGAARAAPPGRPSRRRSADAMEGLHRGGPPARDSRWWSRDFLDGSPDGGSPAGSSRCAGWPPATRCSPSR